MPNPAAQTAAKTATRSATSAWPMSSLKLPESVEAPGLLVGWSLEEKHERTPVGFGFGDAEKSPQSGYADPVLLDGEGHLITVAPTGAGKGRSCIIPALLRYAGPVIVIDPKGENVAVTARRRREMGQEVIVLDPMNITGNGTHSFNPLDLIDPHSADAVDIATMFAASLVNAKDDPRNFYWYQRAQQMLIGLILYLAGQEDESERNLGRLRELIAQFVGESPTSSQLFRDMQRSPHPETRLTATMLKSAASEGLGSILSIAQDAADFLRGERVIEAIGKTSFDPQAVTRGDPLSIYLVLPPHMLESHGRLLRLWVMSLISLITARNARPENSTLFVLDEAAQLGPLPQLRQAITLLRGYGVQTWSFWQDISQLKRLYPSDWETMLNNCEVFQTFGSMNLLASRGVSEISGYGDLRGYGVLALDAHEMLLQIAGDEAVVARKPDYLTDPAFDGLFDPNPFHDPSRPVIPPPPPRLKSQPRHAGSPNKGSDGLHRSLLDHVREHGSEPDDGVSPKAGES